MRKYILILVALVALVAVHAAFAGPIPNPGISQARAPLARSGSTVYLTTNGTIKASRVSATFGTFGNITITGSCVGCGGGSGGGGSGTVTLINPTSLGTSVLHLTADVGVYSDTGCTTVVGSGDTLSCWADPSHGENFISAASSFPYWGAHQRGGHPAVRFGLDPCTSSTHPPSGAGCGGYGGSGLLTLGSSTKLAQSSFTTCVVFSRYPGQLGAAQSIFGVFAGGAGNGGQVFGTDDSNAFAFKFFAAGATGSGNSTAGGSESGVAQTLCGTFDNSTGVTQLWSNGSLQDSHTGQQVSYANAVPSIGAILTGPPSTFSQSFQGAVYEIDEFSNVLSASNLEQYFSFSRQKWNSGDDLSGVSASSSGGSGGSISDPITVNGWTPKGGTASVTGAESVSGGISSASSSVSGSETVGADETVTGVVTGNIVVSQGGAFETPVGTEMEFIPASGSTVVIETSGTRPSCVASREGSLWYSHGNTIGGSAISACVCSGLNPFPSCAWVNVATH